MTRRLILLFITLAAPVVSSFAQKVPMKDFGNSLSTVSKVMFAKNNSRLIAGGVLKIWDINNPEDPVFRAVDKNNESEDMKIRDADISNDGDFIATVAGNRIEIYNINTGQKIENLKSLNLSGLAFGPNNMLAYISSKGDLRTFDLNTGQKVSLEDFKGVKPLCIDWSPSGKYIAIGGIGDKVIIYDYPERTIHKSPGIRIRRVTDLVFSPDNKHLAVSGKNGVVSVVETSSGDMVNTWLAHRDGAFALSFHYTGNFLATGGADKMIKVWSIPEGNEVDTWLAHDKPVYSLDFSSDGKMLASGSENTQLFGVKSDTRIWALDESKITSGSNIIAVDKQNTTNNPVYTKPLSENLQVNNRFNQKRLALIIGNGMYHNGGVLANPENDANDIAARLQTLGFDVMLYNNLDQRSFRIAIDEFGTRLSGYDIGLFYYAGHGIQVKGNNYLIPVDANLSSENDVEYDCVNAGRLLAKMEDAGSTTNIIILDACRDNPFERSWRRSTHGQGLAFMTAPAGSLISYATSPGATASDGSGDNGLFTTALLEYIDEANLSLLEMFQKVRTYVRENSNGEQVPWESTSLEGNFYFKPQNN